MLTQDSIAMLHHYIYIYIGHNELNKIWYHMGWFSLFIPQQMAGQMLAEFSVGFVPKAVRDNYPTGEMNPISALHEYAQATDRKVKFVDRDMVCILHPSFVIINPLKPNR